MKAVETTNIADLYDYMTGVKRAGNTAYDMTIRGFKTSETDKSAIMVDGLPGLTGRFGSPPTIGVERIELVKGPMSVLYGQIQPGGRQPDQQEARGDRKRRAGSEGNCL